MTEAVTAPDSADFERAKQAQAQAANPEQSAWVEANAGSGKTKVLIDRVTRLLLGRPDGQPGAAPNSILCITYTKAAANEMLSRLFSRLGDWSVSPDADLRRKLARLEGRPEASYQAAHLRQARALFAQALETPGGLRIETIHAFCARVLRRFPLEAGISPGFTEIEEGEADRLWQAVLERQIEVAAAANPEAVTCLSAVTGGRGLSIALEALRGKRQELRAFEQALKSESHLADRIQSACGAGSETLEELLHNGLQTELPIEQIEHAVDDLSSLEKAGKSDQKLLIALRQVLATPDPAQRYEIYISALGGAKQDFPSGSNPFTKAAGPVIRDLFARDLRNGEGEGLEITRLKRLQNAIRARNASDRTLALMQIGLPLIAAYAAEKKARAALDFDDLIEVTRRLLTHSNAAEWVLYKLDGGLSHLLLDEAQDTSPSQWALVNALVAEFQSGLGGQAEYLPRTQFVVGDPKQSIYSFQGADQDRFIAEAETFRRRETPLAAAQGRRVNTPEMAMSFRSTPEVLRFVDAVRQLVPLEQATTDPRPPIDADLKPHAPHRSNQAGRVELWPLETALREEAPDTPWTAPTDHQPAHAPRRTLARRIARTLKEMLARGEAVWKEQSDGSWRRVPLQPQDVLILVRSRNDLFDTLIECLKQQQIPVAGADRLRLLDNLGVQDCLNLVRFAVQPNDDLTLAEILRGPFCGLTDDDRHLFMLAAGRSKSERLWTRLQAHQDPIFAEAKSFCTSLLAHRNQPAFEFLNDVLCGRRTDELSGWDRLEQRFGSPVRDPVTALLSAALGFDMTGPASLQTWLADIESQDRVLKRELGEPDEAVRVMTVHGAKGLQAPLVILPDTTSGTRATQSTLFFNAEGVPIYSPSQALDCQASRVLREAESQAGEKESRRLLYVALTRASDRLIIAGAGQKNTQMGYAKTSWYRWSQMAMLSLTETREDEIPDEEILTYGPEPHQIQSTPLPGQAAILSAPAWLRQRAQPTAPPLRLAAPSRLTQDRTQVMPPFGKKRLAALRRGELIHALLQILPSVPDVDRVVTAQNYLDRVQDVTEAARDEIRETSLRVLQDPAFAEVFQPNGRSEAAIAGHLPSGQMVNGRVDRLLITPDQVLIIDYKTDRPAPETAAQIGDAHLVQMAAYRAVLSSLYPDGRPVRCALLYTDGPRLIELDPAQMSESLNRVSSPV